VIDATPSREVPVAPRDVVFTFSYVTFNDVQRRGMSFAQDRLLQTLLRDDRVRRLVVANPFRGLPGRLAHRIRGGVEHELPGTGSAFLHSPLRLRRRDPAAIRSLERTYRDYDRRLRRAAARAGLERPAIITMHPLIAGFAPFDWAGPVTFYCSDDWSAHPGYRTWWPGYREAYARVRSSGRGVCAVSQPIIDRLRPTGPHLVVPNGIEPAEWRDPGAPPEWFERLPRPRALYLGTLDSRLDGACVANAADAVGGGSLVLAGALGDRAHVAALARPSNVHLHEVIGRDAVPGLLAAADVCLIPHARTRLTTAMSPLKLYEYLAAGRPVAAVDLPPLRGLGPRVALAEGAEDFGAAVEPALDMGPQPEHERRRDHDGHAWRQRHEQVLGLALRDP
jgi:glycosyltransferase involved in cell wall biosynthesis